jgi:hypothetical protein
MSGRRLTTENQAARSERARERYVRVLALKALGLSHPQAGPILGVRKSRFRDMLLKARGFYDAGRITDIEVAVMAARLEGSVTEHIDRNQQPRRGRSQDQAVRAYQAATGSPRTQPERTRKAVSGTEGPKR